MDSVSQKILNNYLGLLKSLTPSMKLDLIEKLKNTDNASNQMEQAFGAWKSGETAEDLIESIRTTRKIDRKIEEI